MDVPPYLSAFVPQINLAGPPMPIAYGGMKNAIPTAISGASVGGLEITTATQSTEGIAKGRRRTRKLNNGQPKQPSIKSSVVANGTKATKNTKAKTPRVLSVKQREALKKFGFKKGGKR
jgi:hypothetical protein